MVQFAGIVIVFLVVLGGLMVSGGPAVFAALPMELALIGGAATGTLMIGNSPSVAKQAVISFASVLRGPKWRAHDYSALLLTLHRLTAKAQKRGLVSIENDIEAPETSEIFEDNQKLLQDDDARDLICDSLRLLALDPSTRARLEAHMDETVGGIVQERQKAVSALHMLADALPALGIVAAVLGIIKTMGVIDQSPAVLGEMIAAALLGTFLGVFLAYGLVGPVASRAGQMVEEDAAYLDVVRSVLGGFAAGLPIRTAIEIARAQIPGPSRPDVSVIDQAMSAQRFTHKKERLSA